MYINITSHSQRKGQGCSWLSCNWSWRWPCGWWHLSVGGIYSQKQSVMWLWLGLGLARTLERLCLHPCRILRDEQVPPMHVTDGETEPYSQAVTCPRSPGNTTAQEEAVPRPSFPPAAPPFALHSAVSHSNRHGRRGDMVSLTGIRWPREHWLINTFYFYLILKIIYAHCANKKTKKNPNHPWKTERKKQNYLQFSTQRKF